MQNNYRYGWVMPTSSMEVKEAWRNRNTSHLDVIFFLHLVPTFRRSMNGIFINYLTSTAFQEGSCTFMMIQAQYFQPLLQAKIYSNFVLRNGPFPAPRKVDKNTQRIVTERYYDRCEKGFQSTSFWTILRSETSNDIPFYPFSVKCVKRETASSRIFS